MKKKLRLSIQDAIQKNDIKRLTQIDGSDIESFQFIPKGVKYNETGINAFLYAVMVANLTTIQHICKIIKDEYTRIAEDKLDYSKDELEDNEEEMQTNAVNDFLKSHLETYFSGALETTEIEFDAIAIAELRDNKEILKYLRTEFKSLNITPITPLNREERKVAFDALMKLLGGAQSGWVSKKANSVKYSPPRSFTNERERQLLKQLSTLLHAYLESKEASPVEVQIMHLMYGNKSILVISSNESGVSAYFPKTSHELETAFKYESATATGESSRRLTLYKEKISKRVYALPPFTFPLAKGKEADKERFSAIASLLRSKPVPVSLELTYDQFLLSGASKNALHTLLDNGNAVIFLTTHHLTAGNFKSRHAEEFLVDVAEEAKSYATENEVETLTTVAGKMRPCITCTGRMMGRITFFGQHPGKAYSGRYLEQEKWSSVRSLTCIRKLGNTWITTAKNKKGKETQQDSYDSASDTDKEGRTFKT